MWSNLQSCFPTEFCLHELSGKRKNIKLEANLFLINNFYTNFYSFCRCFRWLINANIGGLIASLFDHFIIIVFLALCFFIYLSMLCWKNAIQWISLGQIRIISSLFTSLIHVIVKWFYFWPKYIALKGYFHLWEVLLLYKLSRWLSFKNENSN